tara:strand:+ start:507 stop:899 length:393 start_codon:yes stop_codon:yes gene_type:complete
MTKKELIENIVEYIRNVNNELGNHYKENIYQNALYYEINNNGYIAQTEVIVPIFYKDFYVGFERADIVHYENNNVKLIIELKSQNQRLGSKEINQLRKYMTNLKCEKGILVNFYETLEIINVTNDSFQKI